MEQTAHGGAQYLRVIKINTALAEKNGICAAGIRRTNDRPQIAGVIQLFRQKEKGRFFRKHRICIPIQLFADRQNSLWVFRIADGGKERICQTKHLCLFFVGGKVVFCGKGIAHRIRKHLPILRDFADKAQSFRNEKPLLIAIFLYF